MMNRNRSYISSNGTFRLDRRDMESRAKLIEESISSLNSTTASTCSKSGPNQTLKSANNLVQFLSDSIGEFVECGTFLATEHAEVRNELSNEINRLRDGAARELIQAAQAFSAEPSSVMKKNQMGASARLLLNSVSRVLAIAEMIDSHVIRPLVESISHALEDMSRMRSIEEFVPAFKSYSDDLKSLINLCSRALQSITDVHMKNDLSSSLGQLAKQALFLYTSSKTYLKLPNSELTVSLHDQVYKEALDCVKKIQEIFNDQYQPDIAQLKPFTIGLVDKINNLRKQVCELNSTDHGETKKRQKLENQVEDVVKSVQAFIAKDLVSDERKNRIVDESNALKMSLHALFESYSDNKNKMNSKMIENIQVEFDKISKSVKRQLRKAAVEKMSHMNESTLEELLTRSDDQQQHLDKSLANFEAHARTWSDLTQMSCTMSSNSDGVKIAKMARKQLESLVPYVLSSARIFTNFGGDCKEACENIQVIKSRWTNQIELLQLAIDDVICINDFLAVYEYQLHRELNGCIGLLSGGASTASQLRSNAKLVCEQVMRIGEMVETEMNNYEPCSFTDRLLESVTALTSRLLVSFSQSVEAYEVDPVSSENDVIECARLIYDSVRDMRSAVFMIPSSGTGVDDDFADFDEEYEETLRQQQDRSSIYCMDEAIGEMDEKTQAALTDEQRDKINQELSSLRKEKTNFDREVLKWDDQSNEIVVLAKQIAVIMMDMIKFTRGSGPYKTPLDIINAAKRINEIGLKLEKLCRKLASECPESQSKKDLIGHLNALPLFCNQLSIGCRVQENIIDPNTTKHLLLITSATSLIISSKNLMNTVIAVVKSSYVASTKYSSKTDNKKPFVQWKMKPPELKPLINKTKTNETADLIRKATKTVNFSPIKTLSEFQG